jgi:hypothetical protein
MRHYPSGTAALTLCNMQGTSVGGQFGWGGTPAKRYRGRTKVSSAGSETRRRV